MLLSPSRKLIRTIFYVFCFTSCISLRIIEAAHSRRSSSIARVRTSAGPAQYDRSISIFSDDGRLLQVEYGMEASHKGGTVACLQLGELELGTPTTKSSLVCVAVASHVAGDDETVRKEEHTLSASSEKVHRVDDHCALVTTGLVGDGRALAQATRVACQQHRLRHGEAPSILEIANIVAHMQHELTRTPGSRPFGVAATIVGVDPFDVGGTSRLFQSEVGGIVEEHDFCATGKDKTTTLSALSDLHQKLTLKRKGTSDGQSDCDDALWIEELVEGVARAILNGHTSSNNRVDIWLLQTDRQSRGKSRFRYAKGVSSLELEQVKKLLAGRKIKPSQTSVIE